MEPVTMLLIDDHPLFRRGLAEFFGATGEFRVIGEAAGALEGLSLAGQLRPELVLIDLHMPAPDGLQVLNALRQRGLDCRKVLLSASMDRSELRTAMRLGADGYMLKDAEPDMLLAYIRSCMQGIVVFDDDLVRLLAGDEAAPNEAAPNETSAPRAVDLTTREAQTLALIAEAMSNKRIAKRLGISEGTVKVYVKNLLRKLGAQSRLELAAFVHRGRVAVPGDAPAHALDHVSTHGPARVSAHMPTHMPAHGPIHGPNVRASGPGGDAGQCASPCAGSCTRSWANSYAK